MNEENNNIKNKVISAIESGQVKMRPKWEFVLRGLLMFFALAFLCFTALYVSSLTVFTLRQNGSLFAPGFGTQGYGIFFSSLPWLLLITALGFVLLLEFFAKRYSFIYGKPFLYSSLGILALVTIGGIGIGFTTFHESIYERHLPFTENVYEYFRRPSDNITVGRIIELRESGCHIFGPEQKEFDVIFTPKTLIQGQLEVGDVVVILGQRDEDQIQAIAIKKERLAPPPVPKIQRRP